MSHLVEPLLPEAGGPRPQPESQGHRDVITRCPAVELTCTRQPVHMLPHDEDIVQSHA